MIRGPLLIDTNVLLLLIVGSTHRNLVEKHKNTSSFTSEDYDLLCETIGSGPDLILLPNVVTETSNLLAQTGEPNRGRLFSTLSNVVLSNAEVYVQSLIAAQHRDFARLGVADCALLSTDDARFHLLTVDLDLYRGFLRAGRPVTNFRHVIDGRA